MHKKTPRSIGTPQRARLRQRIRRFYKDFNEGRWERCYKALDPRLREQARVDPGSYAESLHRFAERYAPLRIEYLRLNLYPKVKGNPRADRDFAFVVILWQDRENQFHLFRERWVKEGRNWFTRVVGLVVHDRDGRDDHAGRSWQGR